MIRWTQARLICRVLCLALMLGLMPMAAGADQPLIALDIPSQPLAAALERYGDATGREVLYDTDLVRGRQSGAVTGMLTPESALQALLAGTGLSASFLADGSFVLAPMRAVPQQAAVDAAASFTQRQYYALIQASLHDAVCRDGQAWAGHYRLAAKFWIDPTGNVSRYERLGTNRRSGIDSDVDKILRTLRIGAPPPEGFMQPVLIMIVPQGPGVTLGCVP